MPRIATLVGIDVSKNKLDWCIRSAAGATAVNTAAGCAALAKELERRGVRLAVMEASGGYEHPMAAALRQQSIGVLIVSPKRVRDFAKAAGRRAKNDPIDADTIAWFGEVFIREGGTQPDPAREQLVALVAERQDVVAMQVQCLNREEHQKPRSLSQAPQGHDQLPRPSHCQARCGDRRPDHPERPFGRARCLADERFLASAATPSPHSSPGCPSSARSPTPRLPPWSVSPPLMTIAASIEGHATSPAAAGSCETFSTWPFWVAPPNITPPSRPSTSASWPRESSPKSPSSPVCASCLPSSTSW